MSPLSPRETTVPAVRRATPWRGRAVTALLAATLLAAPGVAQAAPEAAVPASQEQAAASITWTLERAANPTQDQSTAYNLITSAMNAAVARYNNLSDLGKSITVRYDPGVPTADGNINGTIRFGNRNYMTERTALHEIAHTIGVGTSAGWSSLGGSGTWRGSQATALVKQYDGSGATLSTGGGHFWPYGLNYENEFSGTAADRHVQIVAAMVRDGL
jgi:lipoprotein-anchoring transpeptidase ErfK/SrfK